MNRGKTRAQWFTLVEMLVVIAVIAILSALLLPALGKAREQGRVIVCASNEKQLAVVLSLYTGDFGDWYPFFWHPYHIGTEVRLGYWVPYFKDLGYLKEGRAGRTFDINLHCPSRRPEISGEDADYCIQSVYSLLGGGFMGLSGGPDLGCRVNNVPAPSALVAYGESWASSGTNQSVMITDHFSWPYSGGNAYNTKCLLPWRHGKRGSNDVFCDGHVEHILARDINFSYFNIIRQGASTRPDLHQINTAE